MMSTVTFVFNVGRFYNLELYLYLYIYNIKFNISFTELNIAPNVNGIQLPPSEAFFAITTFFARDWKLPSRWSRLAAKQTSIFIEIALKSDFSRLGKFCAINGRFSSRASSILNFCNSRFRDRSNWKLSEQIKQTSS